MNYDYIIVGQGLAGTTLAHHLLDIRKKVLIVDREAASTSSKVAAGIFNPITGRKMVKTWIADEIFPFLHQYYRKIEALTQASFFHPLNIYRPFYNQQEQNDWMGKSEDAIYKDYIEDIALTSDQQGIVNDQFGGLLLRQSGYLDVSAYLAASKKYFASKDVYIQSELNSDQLQIAAGVRWQDIKAEKLIFCEGAEAIRNFFFGEKPLRPVKGEILDVEFAEPLPVIYNRGVFILPLAKDGRKCRVGATYEFGDLTKHTTSAARRNLEGKLRDLVQLDYKIVGQVAGIRPSSADRRPILGISPKSPHIAIMNGFGTKGVSLAPYFSKVFADYLESGKELDSEIDIKRFFN